MRYPLLETVEKGRVTDGAYASGSSMTQGAFRVACARSELYVLFSAGADWPACQLTGEPWEHASVSVIGEARCPKWEEMGFVKDLFWREEEWVIQFHPAKTEYVNRHPFVLHLWRPTLTVLPVPPRVCV